MALCCLPSIKIFDFRHPWNYVRRLRNVLRDTFEQRKSKLTACFSKVKHKFQSRNGP